jgi:hypothetical protein
MAIVNAFNQGWNVDELKYKVVHSLDGGIQAITNNEADYFMWELFTTKPYVDSGILNELALALLHGHVSLLRYVMKFWKSTQRPFHQYYLR